MTSEAESEWISKNSAVDVRLYDMFREQFEDRLREYGDGNVERQVRQLEQVMHFFPCNVMYSLRYV